VNLNLDPNLASNIARVQLVDWQQQFFSEQGLKIGQHHTLRGSTSNRVVEEIVVEIIELSTTIMENTIGFWSPCIKVRVIDRDQTMIISVVDFLLHMDATE
jgi:hypothetical protein